MGTRQQGDRVDWTSALLFLLLAFVLAWICFIGLRALGMPFQARAAIGMFAPAAAALIVRWWRHEPAARLGLRLRLGPLYLAAYLLPIGLLAAGVVLAMIAGYQHWDLLPRWQAQLDAALHRAPPQATTTLRRLSTLLLGLQLVQALTIAPLLNCIFTFGEELGWRGYLLPHLAPLGGPVAAVLVGIVWGLWHAPVIALDGYEFGIRSFLVAPFFCLFTVPLAMLLAWLRFRSGSVWPCVLTHAVVNSIAGFALLSLSRPASPLIGEPVGLLGVAPFWAFALWLLATGRLRSEPSDRGQPAPYPVG